ncbi:uncharacterized protein LOC141614584 [Silene latifolia]|uniref:uncharacterized protein LOC141614584 n=1 Tax=Silene latifolia TaxID=37657 RepID=UPI003D76F433
MVFKSWASFCYPRTEGGLDIKEVLTWNKTQLLKWIWKLDHKPQSLWVQWVKAYVIQNGSFWQLPFKSSDSWYWSNILKVRDWFLALMGTTEDAQLVLAGDVVGKFPGSVIYELVRDKQPKVRWANILCDSLCVPKHAVISLLVFQNSLPTIDNLNKRGLMIITRCSLCEAAGEDINHLFFKCLFSAAL